MHIAGTELDLLMHSAYPHAASSFLKKGNKYADISLLLKLTAKKSSCHRKREQPPETEKSFTGKRIFTKEIPASHLYQGIDSLSMLSRGNVLKQFFFGDHPKRPGLDALSAWQHRNDALCEASLWSTNRPKRN